MGRVILVLAILGAFIAKALVYQWQDKNLEAMYCLVWFLVINSLIGGALGGYENIQKQKERMNRTKRFKKWYAEDQKAREGGYEEDDEE